jgi:hypothetical protein
MTHRAKQIVDAVADRVLARVQASGTKVFKHYRFRLDDEQDELPAISIDYGDDQPSGGTLTEYESVLTVEANAIASEAYAEELHAKLMELRAEVHIALRTDPKLGLPFVLTTEYGAVDKPEVSTRGEKLVGACVARWLVTYNLDFTNPN